MSGRDHETDHDGNCFRECRECYIKKLELSVENLQHHVDCQKDKIEFLEKLVNGMEKVFNESSN